MGYSTNRVLRNVAKASALRANEPLLVLLVKQQTAKARKAFNAKKKNKK